MADDVQVENFTWEDGEESQNELRSNFNKVKKTNEQNPDIETDFH